MKSVFLNQLDKSLRQLCLLVLINKLNVWILTIMELFAILNYLFDSHQQLLNEENGSEIIINPEFDIDLYVFLESSTFLLKNVLG